MKTILDQIYEDMLELESKHAFCVGFRMGAQIALEVLLPPHPHSENA